ncbi:hypothetical protein [Flocculibacter collagenilyticus]|uniref:hypothetical protein n=1 Tax=Flocculibacter collagenilyticus TaxID=2744479 RepID=UPI0018F74F22|nr:hypothetical protein [Flocculibacter collagenilyticus]
MKILTSTLLLVAGLVLPLNALATDEHQYDSHTEQYIQSVYWLSKQGEGAVVYARHQGATTLKQKIDNAILLGRSVNPAKAEYDHSDELLLMMPSLNTKLHVYLVGDGIIFNKKKYVMASSDIQKLRKMNHYRVEKGDSISSKQLLLAKQRFGLPQ